MKDGRVSKAWTKPVVEVVGRLDDVLASTQGTGETTPGGHVKFAPTVS